MYLRRWRYRGDDVLEYIMIYLESLFGCPHIAFHEVHDHGVHELREQQHSHLRLESDFRSGHDSADALLAQRNGSLAMAFTDVEGKPIEELDLPHAPPHLVVHECRVG